MPADVKPLYKSPRRVEIVIRARNDQVCTDRVICPIKSNPD